MAAKKASAKKASARPAAKKAAAKKTTVRETRTRDEDLDLEDEPTEDDEESDSPVGALRSEEDDLEDEDVEHPDERTVQDRLEDLEEEDQQERKAGNVGRSRTATDKNAERERRLRDLADDGDVEQNRTITGTEGRVRPKPTAADKKAAKKPRGRYKVTATRLGFYDLLRRRPGDTFYMEMEVGKNDIPVNMPSWVVLAKDYVPEDEETRPAKKRNSPDFIRI